MLFCYLLIVVAAAGSVSVTSLNHDVGVFLLEARGLAEGRPLRDMNTPTNLLAPSISLKLSHYLPFYLADVHQALLFAYALLCTSLTAFLLWPPRGPGGVVGFAGVTGVTAILLLLPGYDFGQREHLFALSCAPLLAALYDRHAGLAVPKWLPIPVAGLAAFGASLKPFFIVCLFIFGVLHVALKGVRRTAPELLVLSAAVAGALSWIVLTHPSYFTEALPGALKTYGTLRLSFGDALLLALVIPAPSIVIFLLTIVAVLAESKFNSRSETLPVPLLFYIGAALAAWSLAVMQLMSYEYHFLPFKLLSACGSIIAFAWLLTKSPFPCHAPRWAACLLPFAYAVALLFQPVSRVHYHFSRRDILDDPFTKALQALPTQTPVLMLSPHVAPITPAHGYADIRWTGLHSSLFLLEPIFRVGGGEKSAALSALEVGVRSDVNASFSGPAPRVVFVEVSENNPDRDVLRFLSEDAAFRDIWSSYRKTGAMRSIFGRVDQYEKK